MATKVTTKTGKEVFLLNPAEKATRYVRELRSGVSHTTGKPLTDKQIGYRCGVLSERSLQAKIYNKKHGLEGKAKKRR